MREHPTEKRSSIHLLCIETRAYMLRFMASCFDLVPSIYNHGVLISLQLLPKFMIRNDDNNFIQRILRMIVTFV